MESIVLKVDGMSCSHCVGAVTGAIENLDGTAGVSVDLKSGKASFEYDPEKITLKAIKAAIIEEGYTVSA